MVTSHSRLRAAFVLFAALVVALGVAACGGSSDNNDTGTNGGNSANLIKSNPANKNVSLTVGSKNFTEEYILGNIYAQALKAAGYNVSTNLNLGSEVIAYKALQDGSDQRLPGVHLDAARVDLRRRSRFPPMPSRPMPRPRRSSSRRAKPPSRRRRSPTRTRSAC